MDGNALRAAMAPPGWAQALPQARYDQLAGPCTAALAQANCTTIRRASMFLAQLGEETGGLRWTEEIADGSAYNWRADLGNTQAGDGPRFKGRSFIQITGRTHYGNLSRWAHQQGYVPSSDFFLRDPPALARDAYAFLGPVWYWTVARPQLNGLADAGDIVAATRAVNGGLNGLSERTARWQACLSLGTALLPTPRPLASPHVLASAAAAALVPAEGDLTLDPATQAYLDKQFADINRGMGLLLHGDATHPNSLDALAAKLSALAAVVATLK